MKKFKKNSSIFRRGNGRKKRKIGRKLPDTPARVEGVPHGLDPTLEVHGPERVDTEKVGDPIYDQASTHQYPPPKRNPIFRKVWSEFIDSISGRENFNVGHLNALEILCDLFVEYGETHAFLRTKGCSYQSHGRSGLVWKLYPEVGHLKSIQHQINVYMKQLGLILKRDHSGTPGGGMGEWE